MKGPSENSKFALPFLLATALSGCGETTFAYPNLEEATAGSKAISACSTAKEYDFSTNPEDTEAFFQDAGDSLSSCYYPAVRSQAPELADTRIPLHFNILHYQAVDINDIRDGIRRDLDALNYAFGPVHVTFYASGITQVYDDGVSEFLEDGNRDDRELRDKYRSYFPETAGSPVFYFPRTGEKAGVAEARAPFVFYSNHTGQASTSRALVHEIGHILGLKHTSDEGGKGDGLPGTIDYRKVCGIPDDEWWPHSVETSVEDGVCFGGCPDKCDYKAPVTVMDYVDCKEDVPMGFSPEQEEIVNCELQDPESPLAGHVNEVLPEVDL